MEAGTMEECCLLPCSRSFPSLLSYIVQDQAPAVISPTVGWTRSHRSLIKIMPLQTDLSVSLMGGLSQLRFLFPDTSSLC